MRRTLLFILYFAVWLLPILAFGALVLWAFEEQGPIVGIALFFIGGGFISYIFRAVWARMWGEQAAPFEFGIEVGGDGDGGGDGGD